MNNNNDVFHVGDRVRVNSGITRRVGVVTEILTNGDLRVRFPYGRRRDSFCVVVVYPEICWRVK